MIQRQIEQKRREWLDFINSGRPHLLREAILHIHPADQAEVLRTLENGELSAALNVMENDQIRSLLRFFHADRAGTLKLLGRLPEARRAAALEPMNDEDIAAVVAGLGHSVIADLLSAMPAPRADAIGKLAAGRRNGIDKIASHDFLAVRDDDTVKEILSTMRNMKHSEGRPAQIYVTDGRGLLRGVIELHALLLSPDDRPVSEVMQDCPLRIPASADPIEAARSILYFGLASGPVVSRTNELTGVITADAAYRLLERKLESSLNRIGALGGANARGESSNFWAAVRHGASLTPIIAASLAACLLLNLLLRLVFHADSPEIFLFAWAPLSIAMARLYYWHITILLQRFDPSDPAANRQWVMRVKAGIAAGVLATPVCAALAWAVSDSARIAIVAAAGLAWAIASGSFIAWLLFGSFGRLRFTRRTYFTPALLSAGDFAALAIMAMLFYLLK